MHKTISAFLMLAAGTIAATAAGEAPLYKQADAPIENRVEDLLWRMTLDEKINQVNQYVLGTNIIENNIGEFNDKTPADIGSLISMTTSAKVRNAVQRRAVEDTRLGIPVLFAFDVIHGYRTVYPISLAQGCSFNPALVTEACRVAAREAKLSGIDMTFSPMVDVARDPRWGRVAEGYGEDPYLTSVMGAASVKGYQGDGFSDPLDIGACVKHYVGYAASEAGKDYVYTEISPQTLWDTYLPPFRSAVDAGAVSVMSSFNNISGIPATANHYVLTEVLRDMWGFDGFVVSDWAAVQQLINQGMAANKADASALAINAGVDMDMADHLYADTLKGLIADGKVSMATLDEAVRRILRIKFRIGLFENPYVPELTEEEIYLLPESRDVARRMAEESMVLLKNEGGVLPLTGNKKIAVMGPTATSAEALIGNWRGQGRDEDATVLLDGIVNEFGGTAEIRYLPGCGFEKDSTDLDEVKSLAEWADVVILCLGERGTWSGENQSRALIALTEAQQKLTHAIAATSTPVVVVLVNGRPLELRSIEPDADAIIEAWQPGVNGAEALGAILGGHVCPSGKLSITFPYSQGQIPIYYNRRPMARTHGQGQYKDMTSEPLYEFGHGLSYTTFAYGTPGIDKNVLSRDDSFTITVPVTNTGACDGAETVLVYVHAPVAIPTRPQKELRFFDKKFIAKGSTAYYEFTGNVMEHLAYPGPDGRPVLMPGDMEIIINDTIIPVKIAE